MTVLGNVRGERASARQVWNALRSSNKQNDGVLPYTQYINRPIGRLIAFAAYYAGASPNLVTVISFSLSAIAIGLVFLLSPLGVAEAVTLVAILLLAYAVDSADGRLARLCGVAGAQGEWLDHVLDIIKVTALHGACLFMFTNSKYADVGVLFLANVVILAAAVATFFSPILRDKLDPSKYAAGNLKSSARALLLPFDYGVFCLIFLLTPWPDVFSLIYLIWGAGLVLKLVAALIKSGRRLAGLQRKLSPT